MAYDYGYGLLEDALIDACTEFPPDFAKIRRMIQAGANLNAVSSKDSKEEGNILSEIIKGLSWGGESIYLICEECEEETCEKCELKDEEIDGRWLPSIVELFLQNGFDLGRRGGSVGADCLKSLTWSTYDKYILDAAKILLKAGADPTYEDKEDGGTVMGWVSTKESAAECIYEDHCQSNLFHTLYEIMDAQVKGEDIDQIFFFDKCIGRKINQVLLCSEENACKGIFSITTPQMQYENCFAEPLVFWCEEVPLCVTEYVDEIVDYRTMRKAKTKQDVSSFFADCLGQTITAIDFESKKVTKGSTCYTQPITMIRLSNGKTICISYNTGDVPKEKRSAWFSSI